MRGLFLTLLVGICIFTCVYLSIKHHYPQIYNTSDDTISELLEAHNTIRQSNGLKIFRFNQKLTLAATKHAEFMAQTDRLSHYGEGLSRPSNRVSKEGYQWRSVAENVAYGQLTVEEVMKDWMKSEGHRQNLLGNYQDIGIAVATNKRGQLYWCVVFSLPR